MRTFSNRNIGIDGASGTGKTTLALQIKQQFGGAVISIDNNISPHEGAYWASVQWQSLRARLEEAKEHDRLLIFDGVCLLKILECLAINLDLLIYVRRVNQDDEWLDDWLCEGDLNEALTRISNMERKTPGVGNLDREIAEYHHQYKPLGRADCVFNRPE
jgi:hypothetical protein